LAQSSATTTGNPNSPKDGVAAGTASTTANANSSPGGTASQGGDPSRSTIIRNMTRSIDGSFEIAARIAGSTMSLTDFYTQFLAATIDGIQAVAGAIWLRTPQGFLQLQCQKDLEKVGLEEKRGGRQTHNELLRQGFQSSRPMLVEPGGRSGSAEGMIAANLTEYLIILAPILQDESQIIGMLEIFKVAAPDTRVNNTWMNYVVQMSGYASNYHRQIATRKVSGSEEVWTQIEAFTKTIHSSLNPTEVAFGVANDGRRLVGCDRISVGIRHGRRTTIEAVSGADVVEKSSSHIKRMKALFESVIDWGEKLVWKGERDETLPPQVLEALDAYLAESNSRLLVLLPLRDQRETGKEKEKKKCRSALLMEMFNPPEDPDPIITRFEIMSQHSATALFNASEMKRVPLKILWKPISVVQNGVGGKARFWTILGVTAAVLLIAALVFVPYSLKLDSKGQLLPVERQYVFPTSPGTVIRFMVSPGDIITGGTPIAQLRDAELMKEMVDKKSELDGLNSEKTQKQNQLNNMPLQSREREKLSSELATSGPRIVALERSIGNLEQLYRMKREVPGVFEVQAPDFTASRVSSVARWTVLTPDFVDNLTNKPVRPTDPLMRLGYTGGAWEIEQKIPQKHIGQVLKAFEDKAGVFQNEKGEEYLEVDVLVSSAPLEQYRGRLYRKKIAGEAVPNKDDHNESEHVIVAYVTVNEPDVEGAIPAELLVTGVEVKMKIRCGQHSLGYCLFYGVWEFLYERVVFFF